MIRAFYIESKNDIIVTGQVRISEGVPSFTGKLTPLKNVPRDESPERNTVIIVDVVGMQKRDMDEAVMKVKFPGSDIWYMTCIENSDDVFDGFLSNGDVLLIPYHMIISDDVLLEAYEISDSCIPVLFVSNGKVLTADGTEDIMPCINRIKKMRYPRTIVFDTDGSVDLQTWREILIDAPSTIPYVTEKAKELDEMGFTEIVVDSQ